MDPERGGVVDRVDGHLIAAAEAAVVDELDGHELDAGRDADHAGPVARRGDRPGHVRAVPVLPDVVDGVVVVAEVPAVDVVDEAVGVVIDAVGLLAVARFAGFVQARSARSTWLKSMPSSTTATTTLGDPCSWAKASRPSMSTPAVPTVIVLPATVWPLLSRPHRSS